jgi:hypothetical protein
MGFDYDEDFSLTSGKRGGGGRKQPREKKRPEKNKGNAPTCYSAKHVRAKEALLSKKCREK